MAFRPKKKGRILTLDMTDVSESGGGGFRIEPGEYTVRCEEVKQETSKSGNEMVTWTFKGIEGKAKGKVFYYRNSLLVQALWKLRETLIGLGVDVPQEIIDVDLDELEGLEGVAVVDDEEFQGKVSSRIQSFLAEGASAPEEDEPKKPARSARGNGAAGKSKIAKVSEEEVGEMAEDDLESLIEKSGLEVDLSDYKTLTKKKAAVIAALEEAKLLEA